ncbi:MAG: hormogonium polysaccharide biosynthesis protein HpsA [Cyanobacteriota bacterium]|nr:hormogonium polysaccharide biosynthesis protein HpsA [Cyanobacteriota bacterium]
MSKNKFLNHISNIFRTIRSGYRVMERKLRRSLWGIFNRRNRYSRAGFVLPTVTMVLLVVVLLSIAILLRSFDRAEMARNVKVNQQVLSAGAPALERASAKIDYLLNGAANGGDPTLPPGTPAEDLIYRTLEERLNEYTFGDEEVLKVKYDLDGNGSIQEFGASGATELGADGDIQDNEQITTAWRYPVDTDNNGKFDSYSIYGIFLRTPQAGREYQPLEARTPPQPVVESLTSTEPLCEAINTSSNLISSIGWYKSGTKLKKSIFVYTVNVPITSEPEDTTNFERYKGTPALSALEYQRDYSQNSITNSAVFYENDLEAAPGFEFNINGRIVANGNMMVTSFNTPLKIYQVSGRSSCFYEAGNSKILVGGELIYGRSRKNSVGLEAEVHLFKGQGASPTTVKINGDAESVSDDSLDVVFNDNAYAQRIDLMVREHIDSGQADPDTVVDIVADRVIEGEEETKARREALENYLKDRTRKVPFAEVALGEDVTETGVIRGSGNDLRPQDDWMLPTGGDAQIATTATTTGLSLNEDQPAATRPSDLGELGIEERLGDRIKVGNNLPALRYDESLEDEDEPFAGGDAKQYIGNTAWSNPEATGQCEDNEDADNECRWRETQITAFADVGNVDRNSFWEIAAARKPQSATEGYGGLRVITGAGVYERLNSFLPPPGLDSSRAVITYDDPATTPDVETFPIVWPDTMPMSPIPDSTEVYDNSGANVFVNSTSFDWVNLFADRTSALTTGIDPYTEQYAKGDLRMRATVVYHYAQSGVDEDATGDDLDQEPIACVSSYYDPSDETSSKNRSFYAGEDLAALTDYYGAAIPSDPIGKSNNGIVYGKPTIIRAGGISVALDSATKQLSGTPTELVEQANMVFPDGRFANKPLRDALIKVAEGNSLSIADQAAIDSTQCAFEILDGTLKPNNTFIPHGAIKEVAFLNPREIKAIDQDDPDTPNDETFTLSSTLATPANLTGEYKLPLEERQPLEIRATQIDMNVLRMTTIPNTEVGTDIPALSPEYLLPYSGLVYASRDDALPDRSNRTPDGTNGIDEESSKLLSPTDYKLDPTRRPNGIMLVEGEELNRGGNNSVSTVEDVVKEKGLILVSNVPTYIKGDFNLHDHYEFVGGGINWNFSVYYNPSKALNTEFACRGGDPRIPGNCGGGDKWRPVEIMSDSLTILSDGFRFGFRNEGDFDLRNNAGNVVIGGYDLDGSGTIDGTTFSEITYGIDLNGNGVDTDTAVAETDITTKAARLINGFYANDFAVNGLSSEADFMIEEIDDTNAQNYTDAEYRVNTGAAPVNSSYFNNFITPVQRRANFNEYLMEICLKLPVSACQPQDWVVIDDNDAQNKASDIIGTITYPDDVAGSGTTALAPKPEYQRYPRRIAFKRLPSFELDYPVGDRAIPLGIIGGSVAEAPNGTAANAQNTDNALWFKTGNNNWNRNQPLFYQNAAQLTPGTILQPQLVPALQIHATTANPGGAFPTGRQVEERTRWQMPATADTTVNVMMATGDTPPRVIANDVGETNGGLPNLPRFTENWKDRTSTIYGAFVQLRRSAYSTGPYQHILQNDPAEIFGNTYGKYNAGETDGTAPASTPPTRQWSYDVGFLSQSPDLFAAKLSSLDPDQTKQYYREVGLDDPWVQTLLCSKTEDGNADVAGEGIRPEEFCDSKTGG